jgi:hypothetical protein
MSPFNASLVSAFQKRAHSEGGLTWSPGRDRLAALTLDPSIVPDDDGEAAGFILPVTVKEASEIDIYRPIITAALPLIDTTQLPTLFIAQTYVLPLNRSGGTYRKAWKRFEGSLRPNGFASVFGCVRPTNERSLRAHVGKGGLGFDIIGQTGVAPDDWTIVVKTL